MATAESYEPVTYKLQRWLRKTGERVQLAYQKGALAAYLYYLLVVVNLVFYEWGGYNILLFTFMGVAVVLYWHPYWQQAKYWYGAIIALLVGIALDAYLSILILMHTVDNVAIVTLCLDTCIALLVLQWFITQKKQTENMSQLE